MRLWILSAIVLLLTGCQLNTKPEPVKSGDIAYFKDQRTGLCFAAINSPVNGLYGVVSMTNVPCDKVEKFLEH